MEFPIKILNHFCTHELNIVNQLYLNKKKKHSPQDPETTAHMAFIAG